MENIYDFGRVSYKPAESIKKFTIFEKLLFLCELLIDIIKVLVLSVPHWCISLYRVFVSPRKKSVVGQTVLVEIHFLNRQAVFNFRILKCRLRAVEMASVKKLLSFSLVKDVT